MTIKKGSGMPTRSVLDGHLKRTRSTALSELSLDFDPLDRKHNYGVYHLVLRVR